MDRTNVIGEKVKSLRTAKEISLEELADRTGLAVEQITRIEENIDIPSLAPLVNPEKPDVPLNKNDAFQKVQKRHVQEKR